jgi:hypothetical protein
MARERGERAKPVTGTIDGAFEEGKDEAICLKDEIVEWKDNMEANSMEAMPKYDEVSEAADALESGTDSLESLEVPECLQGVEVTYTVDTRRKAQSRNGRMGNALSALDAAKAGAEAWLEDNEELEFIPEDERDPEETDMTYPTEEEVSEREEQRSAVEEFINELENAYGELEGVNFPGMY